MARFNISSPWVFVPVLYIVFGLGSGGIIGNMTQVLYKDLGYSNVFIGSLSLLTLPSAFVFVFAPYLEQLDSKRGMIWKCMLMLSVFSILLLGSMYVDSLFTEVSITLFLLMSCVFATIGVASNGFFQRALNLEEQARFSGIMTASIRGGIIIGLILLVRVGGQINESLRARGDEGSIVGWAVAMGIAAVCFLLAAFYCWKFLPRPETDVRVEFKEKFPLITVLKEYFKMERVWAIILLLYLYRFGQGMQFYMTAPFYMDTGSDGGMGVDVKTVAMLKTYTDLPWMTLGGILGGFIIARFGLRKVFLPLGILLNLPNIGYVYLALVQPEGSFMFLGDTFPTSLFWISCLESFGYGMGFAPCVFYMYAIAQGPYRTSLLTISQCIMSLGFALPGAFAGYLQQQSGYVVTFVAASIIGFFALILLLIVPIPDIKKKSETVA